jgi:hypothetical protein
MDHYSSIIPRIFRTGKGTLSAITLSKNTTFYSCPESEVFPAFRKHEEAHKKQWAEDGWRFGFWYLRDCIFKGYAKCPYEVEAEKIAHGSANSVTKE